MKTEIEMNRQDGYFDYQLQICSSYKSEKKEKHKPERINKEKTQDKRESMKGWER